MSERRSRIRISVENSDPVEYKADVLVLKYAQTFYGVDRRVAGEFASRGIDEHELMPKPGECRLLDTRAAIPASKVLIVGVRSLYDFRYEQIRDFANTALTFLRNESCDVRHVSMTLHGAGYGLDEIEALEAEIGGICEAIRSKHTPNRLERISIVEGRPDRASRLTEALKRRLPSGYFESSGVATRSLDGQKPVVFVVMPFAERFDNVHYGIRKAVRKAGFICERADQSAFTGEVVAWIRKRIADAIFVICDLTDANPNVCLELGYAWGLHKPTVLLAQDTSQLPFDARNEKCLRYDPGRIQQLEKELSTELVSLRSQRAYGHVSTQVAH
jgi:hypothetical protein